MSAKDKELDWKNRILCSDEGCIGVIGPDGRCKECGLAYQGELPDAFDLNSSEIPESEASAVEDVPVVEDAPALDTDDEWARRTLCLDESCIGVIGPDGRCKECGKPYQA